MFLYFYSCFWGASVSFYCRNNSVYVQASVCYRHLHWLLIFPPKIALSPTTTKKSLYLKGSDGMDLKFKKMDPLNDSFWHLQPVR